MGSRHKVEVEVTSARSLDSQPEYPEVGVNFSPEPSLTVIAVLNLVRTQRSELHLVGPCCWPPITRAGARRKRGRPGQCGARRTGKAAVQARSCQACHGEGLKGQYLALRLAGQAEAYLANQLTTFKTGERRDSTGAMASVAAALSNEVCALKPASIAGRRYPPSRPGMMPG